MCPDPAVLGFFEGECESFEYLARAEPHELVLADVDVDAECLRLRVAEARIGTVRSDDQIVFAPLSVSGIALLVEVQRHPEFARPVLEDLEQALAPDADEAVPRRSDRLAMDVD